MKTPDEILKESARRNGNPEWNKDRYPMLHKEVIEAIESYHAQFEGECEWHSGDGGIYQLPGCCAVGIKDKGLVYSYTYCPFCGKTIKRT
jgi:hypothetical protein